MKLMCTADLHAHCFSDFAKTLTVKWNDDKLRYVETQDETNNIEMNSRLFNIINGLCDIRDYGVQNNIKYLLFGGDLYHHRGTIEVMVYNAVYKALKSFKTVGIEVYAIAGNHDQIDNSVTPVSALHPFEDIIHVVEKPTILHIEDTEVVALPYSKSKEFIIESMKSLREECKDPKDAVLLCHLGVDGGLVGSGMYAMNDEYTLRDLMYNKWKYVVVGHYHQPQLLEYNSIYCGTPVQNNFGDEIKGKDGYNGFFVIDTDKRWDIEFVPVIAPRFITVSSADELNQYTPEYLKSNYIRVKSKATDTEVIQDKLESLIGDDTSTVRLELEKDYDIDHRSDVSVTQSFAESVTVYHKENWEHPETSAKSLDLGLLILSKAMNGGNV